MTLTLNPNNTTSPLAFDIVRNRRKVGTVTKLSPTLWVAALDNPLTVIRGTTLREVREKLGKV